MVGEVKGGNMVGGKYVVREVGMKRNGKWSGRYGEGKGMWGKGEGVGKERMKVMREKE